MQRFAPFLRLYSTEDAQHLSPEMNSHQLNFYNTMMRKSNILLILLSLGLLSVATTSCSLSVNLASSPAAAFTDDLYGVHDTHALREAERILAEKEAAAKAEQERRIAAMIAAANAEADIDDILGDVDVVASNLGAVATNGSTGDVSIYNNIYVGDYNSAYARRLQGFSSLTYRMPSSYWDYRYGDAYFLTLAYDPAFYTVMVMGDQVWVEPNYITNMFGSWNNPYYYGYRYGYNPYYYGYSYGYWDYWGWNSPYWGCDPFYHYHYYHWYGPHYSHHHHHHYYPGGYHPGGPGGHHGHRDDKVSHRPSYGTAGLGSTSRPSYRQQLGGDLRSDSRGGTRIASGVDTPQRGESTTSRGSVGSSARPATIERLPKTDATRTPSSGEVGRVVAPVKGELSSSLSGTTIKPSTSNAVRGRGVTGTSNSSSRSSRATTSTTRSSSSNTKSSVSSSSRSSSVSNRSSSSSRSSSVSSRSSSSSRSSGVSSRSSSSSSRSSSSRSSRR